MSQIRIVTDSSALFANPSLAQQYHIEIVPIYICFGEERFQLGVDMDSQRLMHRLRTSDVIPTLEPPTIEDFEAVYAELNRSTNKILSIHMSSAILDVCANALTASKSLLGRCDIAVVDSQTLSAGLGILTLEAAKLTHEITNVEMLVRVVRKSLNNVYSVFFVKSMQTICHHDMISEAQTILGTMLGIMPFITIEDGEFVIMEKALNANQAVDKMVEFTGEFINVEQLVILHPDTIESNIVQQLQNRLIAELPISKLPTVMYDGTIATYLGIDAIGVVIFETESEDDF